VVVALLVVWLWPVPVMMLCNSSFCVVLCLEFCELYIVLDGNTIILIG